MLGRQIRQFTATVKIAGTTAMVVSPGFRGRQQLLFAAASVAVIELAALLPSTDAFAQCATSGNDPVTLACAANTTTTATTNTTSPNAATSDRTQQFNADLIGQVGSGVTVSGVGLNLVTTKAGGGISFTNSGAVTTTAASNALELDSNGGTVSYSGAGTISSTVAVNGLVLSNTGSGAISVNTSGTIGTSAARVENGVLATAASGGIGITTGTIWAIVDGINAEVTGGGSGGITVVANANMSVLGDRDIVTSITGGTGDTAITYNGALTSTGLGGILATSSSTGTMTIGGTGSVNSTAAGNAIQVTNSATSTSGDITINPSGNISAGGNTGILAQVTNAANNANIVVAPTGVVFAGSGIAATTAGGGNVTVTTTNNLTANIGAGITTKTISGTNTVNITGGTQTAAGANVNATSGSGNVAITVTNGALLQGVAASGGITATTGSGNISVDTSAGLLGTGGTRVETGIGASTASGVINVTANAISAVLDGINAQVTGGSSGGITVLANGGISVLAAYDLNTNIAGGTGNTSITYNGSLVSIGFGGISASSSSTGSMSIGGTGSINSVGAGVGITVTNSASATSGDIIINPTGTINSGGFNSITTSITNAANNANIVVAPTGVITGGISATTAGGGNVTVTEASNITTNNGAGITTTTTSGANTVNITGGTQTAAGVNVNATAGSGNVVVNVTNGALLQGTGGISGGITATTGSGNIQIDTSGGTLGTVANKIQSVSATTTSGGINVSTGAILAIASGVSAQVTGGGSGGITVLANGAVSTAAVYDINTSIAGGTGNTSITYNGTLSSSGLGGIAATSSSTGTMNVGGSGSISSNLAGPGISVLNNAAATSGDITINPTGSINAGGFNAIGATITNGANNANIIIAPTAALTGGISASTTGGGNVTVTAANNVNAVAGAGIATTTTNGTNTVNITGGTVQALTNGIDATAGVGKTVVSNAGTITATQIGVKLTGGNGNAVTNSGTISGVTGLTTSIGSTSVFNVGAITGTGGTAIQFAGSGNTLTIAPTSVITGHALGGGSDTFQLGGSGTGSFAASLIGPAAQYLGFATYNKVGDSTWTLTGTNALALPWTVQQGTLNVAGSVPNSPFTVQAGALSVTGTIGTATVNGGTASIDGTTGAFTLNGGTLFGNGTVASLNVFGGIVAPGHSIGTLHVAGNVGFSGGVYQVETNLAGASDKIVATGAASLTGSTVQAIAQAGNYASPITYTILAANGGVSGAFSGATSSLAYLTPTLSYDADDVFLTLARNPTFFRDQAQTPNQRAVAGALDQFPTTNSLFLAASALTGATTRQALDSLSGEIHASVQSSLIGDSLYLREAVLGRLQQGTFGASSGVLAALGIGGPTLAYATPSNAYAAAFPVKAAPLARPVPAYDYTWWAQGFGGSGSFDGDGNAADLKRSFGGFITGIDRRFGSNWIAGLAAGYSNSSLSVDARASAANVDTAMASGYAGASYGPWSLRSGVGFAWNSIGASRTIAFPGFMDGATTRYGALTSQAFGEVGYARAFGGLAIEPFAGLAYVHLDAEGFTENGPGLGAALAGQSSNANVGYSSLGVRFAETFALANGMSLAPHLSAAWQHAYGDVTPGKTLAFVNPALTFSIAGVPLARDAAALNAGLDLQLSARARLGISYLGNIGANAREQAAKGSFSLGF
jgi:outer membrane autotransporter protein